MSPKKTVLAMAAEKYDGAPINPWWRESKKVINRALLLAREDAEAQKYFLNALTKMAEGDERFRRCLLTMAKTTGTCIYQPSG